MESSGNRLHESHAQLLSDLRQRWEPIAAAVRAEQWDGGVAALLRAWSSCEAACHPSRQTDRRQGAPGSGQDSVNQVVPLRWRQQQEQCVVLKVLTETVLPTIQLVATREQQAAVQLRLAVETERRQRIETAALVEAKQLEAEHEAHALALALSEQAALAQRKALEVAQLEAISRHLETHRDTQRDTENRQALVRSPPQSLSLLIHKIHNSGTTTQYLVNSGTTISVLPLISQ